MSLPLIPLNQIEDGFEKVANEAPDSMEPLIDYFSRYWITKVKWNLWNVSDVDVRTNNIVEGMFFFFCFAHLFYLSGWNHRFNRLVAKHHPNVWHLFDCLKKEEVAVRQRILKVMIGSKKKINKKAVALQEQINSLKLDFNQNKINLDDFLEGLSLLVGTK